MTEYMLIIPDDYDAWQAMTPQQRAAIYATHDDFAARLKKGGHIVTGGAELTLPSTARTVRSGPDGITVTDGPFAESVEQLSGFYLVESTDLADLEQACAIIAANFPVEIRQVGRAVDDDDAPGAAVPNGSEVAP